MRFNAAPAVQARTSSVSRAPAAAHAMVVRLPGAPAMRRVVVGSNSQTASAQDAVFTLTPNSSFSTGTLFDLGSLLGNGTPGLGFDFSHLAALNGNLGVRAIIDPVTQHELALSEQLLKDEQGVATTAFVPLFTGGYAEPVVAEQAQAQPQPQIIVLQQPAAQPPTAEAAAPPARTTEEQQTPLPPVGQFVLVLRSGKQIKAVAFTRQADSVVYITEDGVRGSFPVSDLDVSATDQVNQQHGTPLKLSL